MSACPSSSFLTSLACINRILNLTQSCELLTSINPQQGWGQEMAISVEAQNQKYLQTLPNLCVLLVAHLLTSAQSESKKMGTWMKVRSLPPFCSWKTMPSHWFQCFISERNASEPKMNCKFCNLYCSGWWPNCAWKSGCTPVHDEWAMT